MSVSKICVCFTGDGKHKYAKLSYCKSPILVPFPVLFVICVYKGIWINWNRFKEKE